MDGIVIGLMGTVSGILVGTVVGAKWVGRQYDFHCEKIEKNADKFSDYYSVVLQWIKCHQAGKTLKTYFEKNNYKRIAIYGMNDIAYTMISELKGTGINVDYCIDRNADNLFLEMKCFRPDEELPVVDVCVIALPELTKEISAVLNSRLCCPAVSIEDVVWEI